MVRILRKGQSSLEYTVLIIVVLGAFLTVQSYFKRGIQGRWKATVDEMGDQYDPRVADSSVRYTLDSTTATAIVSVNATRGIITGLATDRRDETNSVETKTGSISAGAY